MNLITRLRTLEAKIYAADAHEAPKYVGQFQDALYEAWPKLVDAVESVEEYKRHLMAIKCPVAQVTGLVPPEFMPVVNALAALEGYSDD